MAEKSWFERKLAKRDQNARDLVNRNLAVGEELLCARMGTFDDIAPFNKKPFFSSGVMGVTPVRIIRISDPYLNVRSIHHTMADLSSSRVAQERRLRTFFLQEREGN